MYKLEIPYTQIEQIVLRFKSLSNAERRSMNEHATRQGYILPMFRAIGWNIDNINEVNPEEKVSRGWVDFSFRISGIPRFFLETKKASEDLNDPRWVKQAIDYSWTKSVTWAILSNFEDLRVFNAEWKEENPFRAQFIAFDIDSYLSDFDRLWWLSREQTASRRLDVEAEKVGKKTKRLPVSQNLFDDLKTWRTNLFKNYRVFNPGYSYAQVDEAVLHLLNRLIFIRTAEDREVESPRLIPLIRELKDKKQFNNFDHEIAKLFREMDAIYNSDLFAPHFSEELLIAPTVLEEVVKGLNEKDYINYNFNAIDADVLGTAYEQYLGHIVAESKEETHVEEKRAKRKSQGIYYTPSFVTKYIVQQTVGRYLEEHGYHPSRPPRVLDMACGSGSFLIEAFDILDRFVAHQKSQAHGKREDIIDFCRRVEVLNQCIFGVDKDRQAVEVARLNLLLRALHIRDRLPMLENIYHDDSLHAETWQQGFPQIMKEGGFDVIIGNPPYVRQETLGDEFKTFAKQNFETYAGTADLYVYFIEQAHKLLKQGGYFGMIVSNKWIRSNYGKALRKYLTDNTTLLEIIDFGELPVFQDAATFPVIIITRKEITEKQKFLYAPIQRLDFDSLPEEVKAIGTVLDEHALAGENWTLIDKSEQSILDKMHRLGIPLGEYVENEIYRGIVTGYNEAFVIYKPTRDYLISEDPNSNDIIKPFMVGDDVRKYHIVFNERYLIFTRRNIDIKNFPAIERYLLRFKDRLMPKPANWQGEWIGRKAGLYEWYEIQDSIDYYQDFEKPKIVYPEIAKESRFAFDENNFYTNNKVFMIPRRDFYLLGLLNSKLVWLFLRRTCSVLGDPDKEGRLMLQSVFFKQLPIRHIDIANPNEKEIYDAIVALVEEILVLQKEFQSLESKDNLDEFRKLERLIAQIDSEIDHHVYKLYELTEEEIKIVEGG